MGGTAWSDLSGVIFIGVGLVADIIKNVFGWIIDFVDELLFFRIIINPKDNPRCKYAIIEELKSRKANELGNTLMIVDGYNGNPEYEVKEGHFILQTKTAGKIVISFSSEKITIRSLNIPYYNETDMKHFKDAVEDIYRKHNAPSKMMLFFTSTGDTWNTPICRKPRNFNNVTLTKNMEEVMEDVDGFMKAQTTYENSGNPYRKGYFLYGETGTGKSTVVELIANEYNMAVYLLNIN